MPEALQRAEAAIASRPRRWLVTGAAGFIGSNLMECLLRLGQEVVGIDNFATGQRRNLSEIRDAAGDAAHRLRFIEGDIAELDCCRDACAGVEVVLHQAALGSVPRSIAHPLATHRANVDGSLNLLVAARDAQVQRFVYAASSSTYGDHPALPKVEDRIGRPLSPYAVSKLVNELYAGVFHRVYGMETVGLRYFNVFGRRQDPNGAYAAVIPRWVGNLLSGDPCRINGDGETSRDFCYVDNVLQANLLAATAPAEAVAGEVFNVACGESNTLNQLFGLIRGLVAQYQPDAADATPEYAPFREGDVRHSLADIGKASTRLGYQPTHRLAQGMEATIAWYVQSELSARAALAEAAEG